jgi:thymidylate synthase
MNNLDKEYQMLLEYILGNGVVKQDRTGTGTLSVFGWQIRHKMSDGFPLLTTKKIHFKSVVTELLWFLRGDTNIKYLVDNNCHIWDGDAYKNYEKSIIQSHKKNGLEGFEYLNKESFIERIEIDNEFAKRWGELGSIYGRQWRSWNKFMYDTSSSSFDLKSYPVDQIQNLIDELKTNPDSRRLMVNAWNVGELDQMVLPPCHYGFQVYTRELSLDERLDLMRKRTRNGTVDYDNRHHGFLDYHNIPKRAISLMWNQRSIDSALGLPFNIASYGLLLEMIAREVNMIPEHLIGQLGDCHLYLDHLEGAKEQISREPRELPKLHMSSGHNFRAALAGKVDEIDLNDFMLIGYDPHPTIKFPLSN